MYRFFRLIPQYIFPISSSSLTTVQSNTNFLILTGFQQVCICEEILNDLLCLLSILPVEIEDNVLFLLQRWYISSVRELKEEICSRFITASTRTPSLNSRFGSKLI